MRWLASLGILALMLLALLLPTLDRRASEASLRWDLPDTPARVGERLPEIELVDLEGEPVRLSELRGQRVLLTFERSVDW